MKKGAEVKKSVGEEEKHLREQLARALADYDNLTKRISRESEEVIKKAGLDLIKKLLPVLDMLARAQEHLKDPGLSIALKEFENVLKSEGIEPIEIKPGEEFNPELEEVTEIVGTENGKQDKVAEVVQTGWKFQEGEVVRHARVKVIKGEDK